MVDQVDHLSKLIPYTYPSVSQFYKKKLQIIFLNPFCMIGLILIMLNLQ